MLEQRIRSELDRTTGPAGSGGGGGDVDGVMRRGRSLRRRLALARGGAAALLVVAAVGVGSLLDRSVLDQPDRVADGVAEPGSINVVPGLDIPIDGLIRSKGSVTLYRGLAGPAPTFDLAGTEQALVFREDVALPDLFRWSGDVVYAGTVDGADVFLQPLSTVDSGLVGFFDRIFDGEPEPGLGLTVWHPASGYQSPDLLGATRPTGAVGGPLSKLEEPTRGHWMLAWPAIPENTAVVGLLRDGEPLLWQRPVAGAAVFLLPDGAFFESLEMVAFDADGSVIGTAD